MSVLGLRQGDRNSFLLSNNGVRKLRMGDCHLYHSVGKVGKSSSVYEQYAGHNAHMS